MAVTYVYDLNNQEVNNPYIQEDYGSISAAAIESTDNGQITNDPDPSDFVETNWYFINISESLIPYGSLYSLSASENSSTYSYVSSQVTFTFSTETLKENVVFTWVGNGTLFEIGNGLERTIKPYVASGTLRMDAVAKKASVSFIGEIIPRTVLCTISGFSDESNVNDYISTPLTNNLIFSGNAVETYSVQSSENTQLFAISGESSDTNIIFSPSTSGSLFAFSNNIESVTYSYTEESIFYGNIQDYGLVSDLFAGETTDYAQVSQEADPQIIDYSFIVNEVIAVDVPFGSLTISGAGEYVPVYRLYVYGSSEESIAYSYVGVGIASLSLSGDSVESYSTQIPGNTQLFSISGNALEAYSAQTPEDTQLFSISGNALEAYSAQTPENTQLFSISGKELVHPDVDYTPHYGIEKNIGIGTTGIQLEGEKLESRTYVYDEFDFIEFSSFDYGLISNIADESSEDYGNFDSTPIKDNFGFIVDPLSGIPISSTLYPFGSIYVLGSGTESFNITPYSGSGLLTISGFSSDREIQVYGLDYLTTGIATFSGSLVERVRYSYLGLGSVNLSGNALETYSANTPENTQLFSISGNALEAYSAQTPENTQLFSISGTLVEKDVDSYVGIGNLTFSGSLVERVRYSYVGLGSLSLFGDVVESYSTQIPENTQLFAISGTLVEKDVDSYVGIGTLIISGTLDERVRYSYLGLGSVNLSGNALETYSANTPENTQLFSISGNALEAYSAQTPENTQLFTISGKELVHPDVDYTPHYGIEKNIGIGTTGIRFVPGSGFQPDSEGNPRDARTYSNRYPINDKVPGVGIGTIFFDQTNNIAKYSPLTPYSGLGVISVVTGFSPQEQYPYAPLGIGKSWSFSRTSYISQGTLTVSGISSTRKISVYGYYGDDRDPGTSGNIIISKQTSPSIEKEVDSYVGLGTVYINELSEAIYRETNSYQGSGSLNLSGNALEVYSANTPEDTQLFIFSGNVLEAYSAQTPENTQLFIFSGNVEELITNDYSGSGSISLSGSTTNFFVPTYPVRGLFRFTTHHVDNDFDTCDNDEITCDYQNSASSSLSKNPVENIIEFEISGSGLTAQIDSSEYVGVGLYEISGTYINVNLGYSEVGFGTVFISSFTGDNQTNTYIGSGSILGLFGSSNSYSVNNPQSTILLSIGGSATTIIESDYTIVGIGLFNFSGESSTRKISTFIQSGFGTATLSGELLHPDIIFIPSQSGNGFINIIGSSDESFTKKYEDASGTLFALSSGSESFSESGYVGLGSIYIEQNSASTVNNPFQIPRTYVTII